MAKEEPKREVNFSETIKLPAVDETDENVDETPEEEEKETPSESSPEEKPDEVDDNSKEEPEESQTEKEEEPQKEEPIEPVVVPEKKPKPVEGETPRETALRLETQRLKKELRSERSQKLLKDDSKPAQTEVKLSQEEEDLLKQYKPEEIDSLKKVLDILGKEKGFVRRDEAQVDSYQNQASEVLDIWLDLHPEYLPENDKDNVLWGRFTQEYSLYKRPSNPRDLKRIFEKIHRDVFGISEGTNLNKINAQKEKVKVASHSGASPGSPKSKTVEPSGVDPALGSHLIGFTEEEKKEIFGG